MMAAEERLHLRDIMKTVKAENVADSLFISLVSAVMILGFTSLMFIYTISLMAILPLIHVAALPALASMFLFFALCAYYNLRRNIHEDMSAYARFDGDCGVSLTVTEHPESEECPFPSLLITVENGSMRNMSMTKGAKVNHLRIVPRETVEEGSEGIYDN